MNVTYVPNPQAADGRPVIAVSGPPPPLYIPVVGQTASITLREDVDKYSPIAITGYLADSNDQATFGKLLGLSSQAGTAGATILVFVSAEVVNAGWNWVPGSTVFLSGKGLSSQVPTAGYVQQLGVAKDATTLEFSPQPPIQI